MHPVMGMGGVLLIVITIRKRREPCPAGGTVAGGDQKPIERPRSGPCISTSKVYCE